MRRSSAAAAAALGLLATAFLAWAAGPKSGGGGTVVVDDLPTGSAGSVGLTGAGDTRVDGGLGQTAAGTAAATGAAAESGYFSRLVAAPQSLSTTAAETSSMTFTWSDAAVANPSGTEYAIEASSALDFTGTIFSSAAYSPTALVEGLRGNTTYYGRIRAKYMEGDDSSDLTPLDPHLTKAFAPANGVVAGFGARSARLAWDGSLNFGGGLGTWAASASPLPSARQAPAAAAFGRRVYVSGGINGGVAGEVYFAVVEADGSLGSWNPTTPLPAPRHSHAMAAWQGVLYVVGGFDGSARSTVWHAPILADGSAGEWRATTPLPAPRFRHALAVHGGRLYVSGGDNGVAAQASVYYADIQPDGSLGAWTAAAAHPAARSGHAMAVSSGTLYVAGGVTTGVTASVLLADLSSGAPASWAATASLPAARTQGRLLAGDGRVFFLGGHDGNAAAASVYSAMVQPDRTLGAWTPEPSLPAALFAHAAVRSGGRVFVVGGADDALPQAGVHSTRISGTEYLAERATDAAFTQNAAASGWSPGTEAELDGLAPNATYFFRVRGRNGHGLETSLLSLGSTVTLAAVPASALSTFTFVEVSSIGVQWSAGLNPLGTEFRVQGSTAPDFTGAVLEPAGWGPATLALFSTLNVNTSYYFRVQARNANRHQTPYLSLGAVFTLSSAPVNTRITSVQSDGFALEWSTGNLPFGTRYEAQASTASDFASVAASSVTLSSTTIFSGLPSAATFYARVRSINGNGLYSAFDAVVSTRTSADTTAPAASTGAVTFPAGAPGAVVASWVSPGDDGSSGALPAGSAFFIQWSTLPASQVWWSTAAAQVVIATGPLPAGTRVSAVAGGLPAESTATLKLWARDEADNYSAPSDAFAAFSSPFSFARLDGASADVGRSPSLALDRFGNLHLAYRGAGGDLRYLKRTGRSWGAVESPDPGVIAAELSLAVDNDGNPQLAYRDAGVARIKVARSSGGWSASVVEPGEFRLGGMVMDAEGRAGLSYHDVAASDLKFASWTGVAWSTSTLDPGANAGRLSALALDGAQNPDVIYADDAAQTLRLMRRTSVWTGSVLDGPAVSVASGAAAAIDADGTLWLAYVDAATGKLKAGSRAPGGTVSLSAVDDAAASGGIALDGAGRPFVAYWDSVRRDLKYARFTGVAWTTGTIDADGELGEEAGIAIDGSGSVAIAYYDAANGDLKLAEWALAVPGAAGGNAAGRAQAPSAMAGTALAGFIDRLQWTWTDNALGELGFRLYGSTSPAGPFELVRGTATLGGSAGTGGTVSFTETGLAAHTTYYRYAVVVASGGVAAARLASAYPYDAVDLNSPTVADNQAGDGTWRRANTGFYDVDFADTGGSKLSKFQVRASTVPGGAGPDLPGAGLTDVVTAIDATAYTTDWQLPEGFFTALWEGVTNYISLKVFDGNNNAATLSDAFYVLKDTTPPSLVDGQAGDDTPRQAAGTAYNVDAVDRASGLAAFQYSASKSSGAADGGVLGWTDVTATAGLPAYMTDWQIDFAALPSDVTTYISVRTWDVAGATASLTDAFYVVKDTAGPLVRITTPTASFLSALATILGTAKDPRGIGGTELAFQENPPGGLYWTGSAFSNAAPVWLGASAGASWQLSPAIAWQHGKTYRIVARSTDTLGNYSGAYSTATFTFDSSTPTVTVTDPVAGSVISALPVLAGTAVDSGAGLAKVEVALTRNSDGRWWDWAASSWSSVAVTTVAAGTASWSVTPTALLKANLSSQTSYFLAARAVDLAEPANAGFFLLHGPFTFVDNTPPAAVGDLAASSSSISGRIDLGWTAPGDDGSSGIILVGEYRVHYSTDSSIAFSTAAAQVVLATGSVLPGSRQDYAVGGLIAGATYFLRVFTADDAGNWSSLSNGATMQAGPPLFNQIAGRVIKVSSEGITAVQVDCYDSGGALVSSTFTVADGSGSFRLDNIPVGAYKVQATWTADGIASSVWQDGIPMGAGNVDFVLNLSYTLATLTGTLQTLATPQGRRGAAASAFLVSAEGDNFASSKVELFAGGRRAVEVAVSPTGRWTIPNLLPGKYGVRAFNGISYTDVVEVEVGEGELKEVGFVYSPLPEPSVFAFPNPARSRTTIRFETPLVPLEAQVMIFDVAGSLVRELSGSEMTSTAPGLYHAPWDLRNSRGEPVASGVYLFMVKVRGGSENQTAKVTKKLAVVK